MTGSPVVVGVDGSPEARWAAKWAARDAVLHGRPLRLVHAYLIPAQAYPHVHRPATAFRATMRRAGGVLLRETERAVLAAEPAVEVETSLREGDTRVVLIDESRYAAAVVLGSRGLKGAGRLLLGSAGLAVAVHGHCPVVVVRADREDRGPVVVGVDGWPEAAAAVRFAFHEASSRGTGVTALRTWAGLRPAGRGGSAAEHERERESLAEQVAGIAAEFPGVPVDCVVVRGKPGKTLLEYGEHARLIVVGSRGHGGLAGLLTGSTSQEVAADAQCPVAVVRTFPARKEVRAARVERRRDEMDEREKARAGQEARQVAGKQARGTAELADLAIKRYVAAQQFHDREAVADEPTPDETP
ncbi:universal stress protein [Amycolatopsis sp. NPDC059657]|uniref:universal stress protein n=1 Tax=Amycolatopsis sp. NPDC059657 TaxID=3346899 RepID=UPI00366B91FA